KAIPVYRIFFIAMVALGGYISLETIWVIADIVNGLMAVPNLIALLALSPVIISETRRYFNKHQSGTFLVFFRLFKELLFMSSTPTSNLQLAKRGPIVSIVAYLLISIAKLIVGYSINSSSLIADGFNNVSDILSNVTLLIGLHLASKPADEDHRF